MLRLIFAIIFLGLIATASSLLYYYDFVITAEFQDYLIETSAARITIILLFSFIAFYAIISLIFWLRNSPKRLLTKRRTARKDEAYSNITRGFSALASGDLKKAQKYSDKAQKTLPNQPLLYILQAQIAVSSNHNEDAEKYYRLLSQNEDAAFLGYRGLIRQLNDTNKAAEVADELLRKNPKSTWAAEALIDLSFENSAWDKLEKYLKRAEANKSIAKDLLSEKFAIYYFMRAKIADKEARIEDAEWLAERSLKHREKFLPAAIFLSELFTKHEEYKKAKQVIEKTWSICPHPLLAANYNEALKEQGDNFLKKIKKLYELSPDDIESIAYYASALIAAGQNDEAKKIIEHGLTIRTTRKLCGLMAQINEKNLWLNKQETAYTDKCWYCSLTGTKYSDWQLYSDSGKINTIIWSFPQDLPATFLQKKEFEIL